MWTSVSFIQCYEHVLDAWIKVKVFAASLDKILSNLTLPSEVQMCMCTFHMSTFHMSTFQLSTMSKTYIMTQWNPNTTFNSLKMWTK